MKIIYLIKHSGPFVDIQNYEDVNNVLWEEYNKNMILSVEGEKKALELSKLEELKNIDEIYSSNSVRAIGTAKYIAEINNKKIKLDDRINERIFGIDYLKELPKDFNKISFDDNNFKLKNGESFNEVYARFNNFISDLFDNDSNNIVIVVHGLILLSYLQKKCYFKFDGKNFEIKFKNKRILNGNLKNPDIYKLVFENNNLVDIENISLEKNTY